ncbi:MAG: hypothetical protein SCJ94_01680 [Bacillota bacterium]|nr:hypothetical protein [Bacillota bacterium]
MKQNWQSRRQDFLWANDLEYDYDLGRQKKRITVHVVICRENWEKIYNNGVLVREKAFHAWISSDRITKKRFMATATWRPGSVGRRHRSDRMHLAVCKNRAAAL